MAKLSIVISCYNDAEHIEQAVDSAINQSYEDKEIIVIDDGSNENTKNVLEKIKSIDLLITQKNLGPSEARNTGIGAAKGEYILVLDSDDFFYKSFSTKAIQEMENDPEKKIIFCWYNRIQNDQIIDVIKPPGGKLNSFLKYNAGIGNGIFRKEDWEKTGGYDSFMRDGFEDWEFNIRLLINGGEAFIIPEVLFNYRVKPSSRTTLANQKKYSLVRYIYQKHRQVYLENCDEVFDFLLHRIEILELSERKIKSKSEYRIGEFMLAPYYRFKRFIKK